jgi:hypothetical protein
VKLWEPVEIQRGKEYHWCMGNLRIWCTRNEKEWMLAWEHGEEEAQTEVARTQHPKPEHLTWERYVCAHKTDKLQLVPVLQDRPVVLNSDITLKILPGNEALFFVGIPVWVRVRVGTRKDIELAEIPTQILSNTWFGDPTTGELCYSLQSRAGREIEKIPISAHKAVCPVLLMNGSTVKLDFQKLDIHVEHLRVYAGAHRLWTNEVGIRFLGDGQPVQVEFSNNAPSFEKHLTLLAEERVPTSQSILKKSIGILRHFTNF